ncbi:MAG: excinuclease ABC subunit UvrC [bacterium]
MHTHKLDENLKNKALLAPHSPGLYIFKNNQDHPIYIGKAKDLRNRLLSYFSSADLKASKILSQSKSLEIITLQNEQEALILEADLVKFHHPKYNVQLKDDKHFPYIRIDLTDPWPFPEVVRKISKDNAVYFGPYIKPGSMRKTLTVARKIFKYRSCKGKIPSQACLDYYIELCSAPCINNISKQDYNQHIAKLIKFLSGDIDDLIRATQSEMEKYAEQQDFEKAAQLRDQLVDLKNSIVGQRKLFNDGVDRDIMGFSVLKRRACCFIMQIREGRLTGSFPLFLEVPENTDQGEIVERFMVDYYRSHLPPREILLRLNPDSSSVITDWLKQRYKYTVNIKKAHRITAKQLLFEMEKNAAKKLIPAKKIISPILYELAGVLRISTIPELIYIFDISHTHYEDIKGSQVVYKNARTYKKLYRQYNLKSNQDDLASIREVVERCSKDMTSGQKEKNHLPQPDLMLIDGGFQQLVAAKTSLQKYNLKIPVFALAKRFEQIYNEQGKIISLPKYSPVLLFLRKIRDEAHRYGITQHRKARDKKISRTQFTSIPGVGEKTAGLLRKKFKSLQNLKKASPEEIAEIPGLGKKSAERILNWLNPTPPDRERQD